jgi:hypothetical protein
MGRSFPAIDARILSVAAGCGAGLAMVDVGNLTVDSSSCCGGEAAGGLRFMLVNATPTGQGLLALTGDCGALRDHCVEIDCSGSRSGSLQQRGAPPMRQQVRLAKCDGALLNSDGTLTPMAEVACSATGVMW